MCFLFCPGLDFWSPSATISGVYCYCLLSKIVPYPSVRKCCLFCHLRYTDPSYGPSGHQSVITQLKGSWLTQPESSLPPTPRITPDLCPGSVLIVWGPTVLVVKYFEEYLLICSFLMPSVHFWACGTCPLPCRITLLSSWESHRKSANRHSLADSVLIYLMLHGSRSYRRRW